MSEIAFPAGLPGFEQCRRFVLLAPEEGSAVRCLRSVEGPAASFLVVDPHPIEDGYAVPLGPVERRRLDAAGDTPLVWLALVAAEQDGTISVNLRAPIVINAATMTGTQLIPAESPYPMRRVLVQGPGPGPAEAGPHISRVAPRSSLSDVGAAFRRPAEPSDAN
jgi:flagellar assembly factor FliW